MIIIIDDKYLECLESFRTIFYDIEYDILTNEVYNKKLNITNQVDDKNINNIKNIVSLYTKINLSPNSHFISSRLYIL